MTTKTRENFIIFAVSLAIVLCVVSLFALMMGASKARDDEREQEGQRKIDEYNRKVEEHNRQQIAECKALGGFAHTTVQGELIDCSLPSAR